MQLKNYLYLLAFLILLNGCAGLARANRFAKCEFRSGKVDNLRLAGVNINGVETLESINLIDAGKITVALTQKRLPLSFTYNLEVRNPNDKVAALSTIDWVLVLDGTDVTEGTTNQRIEIPPGEIRNMTLDFSIDLFEVLNKEAGQSLLNLALSLVNKNKEPVKVSLKVKPSFLIAGVQVKYPGYFKVEKEFGAQ